MKKIKSTLMIYLSVGAMAFILLFGATTAVASVVVAPIEAVSDFFASIGNFFAGDSSEGDDLITLLRESLNTTEVKVSVSTTYNKSLSEMPLGKEIPAHELVVIQMLAGIEFEDVDEALLSTFWSSRVASLVSVDDEGIETVTYELRTLEAYVSHLLTQVPFSTTFSDITVDTLVSIINAVGPIESTGGFAPDELIEKYKGKLMFPQSKIWPMGASVGWYVVKGEDRWHNGLDFESPCGEALFAMDDGYVMFTNQNAYSSERGNYIIYMTQNNLELRYYHLQSTPLVGPGESVTKGQIIAFVGNTGLSTGCHLHLETRVSGEVYFPEEFLDLSMSH